jgi:hypothetical protein
MGAGKDKAKSIRRCSKNRNEPYETNAAPSKIPIAIKFDQIKLGRVISMT